MAPKSGDDVPNVPLLDVDGQPVNLRELTQNRKAVLIGIPGAFTPVCSTAHIPGYVERADQLHGKGVEEIICVSINDPYVMSAWEKDIRCRGKVKLLADPDGRFTNALGSDMLERPSNKFGDKRSRRYAAILENGHIKAINVDEGGDADKSRAEVILDML